jgi:threonine/homoserine/homoserine lactone efflux protein
MDLSFLHFLAGAMIISLSGVMAPGPLSAATVSHGNRSPHAGAFIALGHGMVELPLMAALFMGFGSFFSLTWMKQAMGLAGGAFMLFMALGMFRSMARSGTDSETPPGSPLAAGALLSAANPYYYIWWATVGVSLAMQSAEYGLGGVALFMAAHWLCDLGWSWLLSALSFRGGRVYGKIFQRAVALISGAFLVFFGIQFIIGALRMML